MEHGEFLIPCAYTGGGAGISIGFAGLNEETYLYLGISVDGEPFHQVERCADNPFASGPYVFEGLEEGRLYRAVGRLTTCEGEFEVSCILPACQAERGAMLLRSVRPYPGGGASSPPAPPREVGT